MKATQSRDDQIVIFAGHCPLIGRSFEPALTEMVGEVYIANFRDRDNTDIS